MRRFALLRVGACSNLNILPPEISMIPTLLADGTLLADDA